MELLGLGPPSRPARRIADGAQRRAERACVADPLGDAAPGDNDARQRAEADSGRSSAVYSRPRCLLA